MLCFSSLGTLTSVTVIQEYWVKGYRFRIGNLRALLEDLGHPTYCAHLWGFEDVLGCNLEERLVHAGKGVVIYMLDAGGCWRCKMGACLVESLCNCTNPNFQHALAHCTSHIAPIAANMHLHICRSAQPLHYLPSFKYCICTPPVFSLFQYLPSFSIFPLSVFALF